MRFQSLLLLCGYISGTIANPAAVTTSLSKTPTSSKSAPTATPQSCRKTKVAIIGAGVAGVAAAQTLHNASISDFLLIDVNSYVGGRLANRQFGKNPKTGKPFTIEKGANWVQGLGGENGGPENPIWRLAKKWGVKNTYSNFESLKTYDKSGEVFIPDELWKEWDNAYNQVEQDAGQILTQNLQDRTMRTQLRVNGWKPRYSKDNLRQTIEWFNFDFEYAYSPEQSSTMWSVVNYNSSFYQFSDANNLVWDQRGFSHFIVSEANTFLKAKDSRLLLSTNITKIDYSSGSTVKISTSKNTCIEAEQVILTVSLGVLQAEIIEFKPQLPKWKREAIESMQMGTYTKIFMQFPPNKNGTYFWDTEKENTQYYLYADPEERGYYPLFQSLEAAKFLPGSGILFGTVVNDQSYIVESQSFETTKKEILTVLRRMFGKDNVPEPIDFYNPRWSQEDWTRGSYSNWPIGLSLETHQNLRADVGNGKVWFAGEATSVEFFGFLQGAYDEGSIVGQQVAACIKSGKTPCKSRPKYEVVKGCTTGQQMLVESNGWYGRALKNYQIESTKNKRRTL